MCMEVSAILLSAWGFGALFVALHIVAGVQQLCWHLAAMEVPVPQRLGKSCPINFRAGRKLVRGTFIWKINEKQSSDEGNMYIIIGTYDTNVARGTICNNQQSTFC